MKDKYMRINEWMWWAKGECVVRVLHTGHFPTSVIARLPDDREIEIDMVELDFPNE